MYSDFHLHSRFSPDSTQDPEMIVLQAIDMGMKSICITDHQDLDYPAIPDLETQPLFMIDPREYFWVWNSLREKYKNEIEICIGLEAGIEEHTAEEQTQRTQDEPYDFIINSCHVASRKYPFYQDFFNACGQQKGMRIYLENVYSNVCSFSNYSVAGHLDFLLRYAPDREDYRPEENMDIIEKILRKVISDGKGIEANSAGFRNGLNGPNPCRLILEKYHALGGDIITIGSDAHTREDIGANFKETGDMLKDIGFKYYCTFKERQPQFHML